MAALAANQALAGFAQYNAVNTVNGINMVSGKFFFPIVTNLRAVQNAEWHSDEAAARTAAAAAKQLLDQLKSENHMKIIGGFAVGTGSNAIRDLWNAFYTYEKNLEASTAQAQTVADSIRAWRKSNQAGLNLVTAAQQLDGAAYDPKSCTCDELLTMASWAAGTPIIDLGVQNSFLPPTAYWFEHGLGDNFVQVYGGNDGSPLSALVSNQGGPGALNLPIGSVLVAAPYWGEAHGHAAIVIGTAKINGKTQLVLYDANDSQGYSLTLTGDLQPGDLNGAVLNFPGQKVGEHATGSQLGLKRLVKVFAPVGHWPQTYGPAVIAKQVCTGPHPQYSP
jgi:hypothetical protein